MPDVLVWILIVSQILNTVFFRFCFVWRRLVNTVTGESCRVIPLECPPDDRWPCLSEGLDQGSKGIAYASFLEGLEGEWQMLYHAVYDLIHRLVRDLKGALKSAAGGKALGAQLQSAFLYSLNAGPFQMGTRLGDKVDLLERFIANNDWDSYYFVKYGAKWAADMTPPMPFGSEDERQAAWAQLPLLYSFLGAGGPCKLARWLDWNDKTNKHLPEFWAFVMLLDWEFSTTNGSGPTEAMQDPAHAASTDPVKELRQLRGLMGGFKLAHKLMTQHAQIV